MQPASILESALYVTDLAAAEAFYGGVLGMECIARVEGRHIFFRCGKSVLLLFNAEATRMPPAAGARLPVPPHGTIGQGHLCFAATAAEIAQWKAHLEAKGVAVEADFEWPPKAGEASGGRSIYLRDPSGNSLEFAEPRIWATN